MSNDAGAKKAAKSTGYIAVDLDGTLARALPYDEAVAKYGVDFADAFGIGEPVQPMLDRVKRWLAAGIDVRILTARMSDPRQELYIRKWLNKVGLPVDMVLTNAKDYGMIRLFDDRAVAVEFNTGRVITDGTDDILEGLLDG